MSEREELSRDLPSLYLQGYAACFSFFFFFGFSNNLFACGGDMEDLINFINFL